MTTKERSILRALYNDTSALDPNNNQHGPSSTAIMADAELKDGYLTVKAATNTSNETKDV